MELLLVGALARSHGLKGELVVVAHNPDSPIWRRGQVVFTLPALEGRGAHHAVDAPDTLDAEPLGRLVLTAARRTPDARFLCAFEDVTSRDASEALEGLRLGVALDAIPPAADDEIYHRELKGFAVVDKHGAPLGTVIGVFPGPAQDLVEVRPPPVKGKRADTYFVPFVAAIVIEVDRAGRRLVLDPPEGLVP